MWKLIFYVLLMALAVRVAADGYDTPDTEPCDPGLVGNVEGERAYQFRGDRCEGIYKDEVSAELSFDSLIEVFEPFDTADERDLEIRWSPPPEARGESVRLRAKALVADAYYRMDANVGASRELYSWPCDVLDMLGYERDDLGLLGWIRPSAASGDGPRIYLPLRIRQRGEARRSAAYEAAFTPAGDLEQVFVHVRPADARGESLGAPLGEAEDLGYGPYPAGTPVFFDVSDLPATGYYQVEIMVTFPGEGSANLHVLFYHEEI